MTTYNWHLEGAEIEENDLGDYELSQYDDED